MSTSYALLLGLVIFLVVFIYFVFFSVSLRLEKNENEAEIAVKRKSVPFRWKDLIDSKEIDAVYIATLNNTHVDLILECAKNNKKILCEKPIGLNLDQASYAQESIKKNNILFYEL